MVSYLLLFLTLSVLSYQAPLRLTSLTYRQFIADHPIVLAHLFEGQCFHCQSMHEQLQKIQTVIQDHNFQIVEANCSEQHQLCSSVNPPKYPSILLLCRGEPVFYHGQLTSEELKEWISELISPPIHLIEEAAIQQKKVNESFVLTGGLELADKILLSAAIRSRFIGIPFYETESNQSILRLYEARDQSKIDYQLPIKPFLFAYEVFHRTRPYIMPLSKAEHFFYFTTHKDTDTMIILFDHADVTSQQLRKVLTDYCRKQLVDTLCFQISKQRKDYQKLAEKYKIDRQSNSQIVLLTNFREKIYHLNSSKLSYSQLSQFVKKAKAGKIASVTFESIGLQTISYSYAKNLDATSYSQAIKSTRFVFVQYFSPSCGYCREFSPQFDKVAQHFHSQPSNNIIVGAVDAEKHQTISDEAKIQGYPTFKLFVQGESIPYEGSRKAEAMIEFLIEFSRSKLLIIPHAKDARKPAVVISGIDAKSSLHSLPALFRRYPIYYAFNDSETAIKIIEDTTKIYTGKLELLSVSDWLEEETAPTLLSLGESPPSKTLERSMKLKKPILTFVNKGENGSVQNLLKILESFCQVAKNYVCGSLNKGEHDYESLIAWMADSQPENRIVWIDTKNLKCFFYEGELGQLSHENLQSFVARVESGKVKEHSREKKESKINSENDEL